jgi:DNA polymerase I-like protein with 3'-5' exonuclease and polymerase domains
MNDNFLFDIESDGLLDTITTIHSIVIRDADTGIMVCSAGPAEVPTALVLLSCAKTLIGHNCIEFDLPAIQKLYPKWTHQAKVVDTLVCSRLIWPEIMLNDITNVRAKHTALPGNLWGSHTLEAWGHRLGVLKGSFGKGPKKAEDTEENIWAKWTPEMQTYCEQDTLVLHKLYQLIQSKNYSEQAMWVEHEFTKVLALIGQHGFPFDREAAVDLYARLSARREEVRQHLQKIIPPTIKHLRTKTKEIPFNPGSRPQVAEFLKQKYGWVPEELTDTGLPKIDDDTLSTLEYPEAKPLTEYFLLAKRIGQLAEGKQSWMKHLKADGRVHGRIISTGCVSGRCSHSSPNMAQVPSNNSPYGHECRSLFVPPSGMVQVGADASGLELRTLANRMAMFDNGAYGQVITSGGDIHTLNQKAAGLDTRDQAKTFIYALIYGAFWEKLGDVALPKGTKEEKTARGRVLQESFFKKLPALKQLADHFKTLAGFTPVLRFDKKLRIEREFWRLDGRKVAKPIIGLDGRLLHGRSSHSILNLVLQSDGALVMKVATILLKKRLDEMGWVFGREYAIMGHIHDEIQGATLPNLAETFGKLCVESIQEAGRFFEFRCPLDGAFKIGRSWAETH